MITARKIIPVVTLIAIVQSSALADWRIKSITESSKKAEKIEISESGELKIDAGVTLSASDWFAVESSKLPFPELLNRPSLFLTNGDCIPCRIVDCDGTTLKVKPDFAITNTAKPLNFPLNSVIGWFRMPPTDREWAELANKTRNRDLIVNRKGDILNGSLTLINESGMQVKDGSKTITIDRESVTSLLLNTDLARIRKPKGKYYLVRLSDGTRLTCTQIVVNSGKFSVKMLSNDLLEGPAELVSAVRVEQGPAIALSDLKPSKQNYQTFDGETRNFKLDANSYGNAIRLRFPQGEARYSRGLGLPGGSSITYELAGKYKRLQTTVGLDSRDGRRGELILKIFVDDKLIELPKQGRIDQQPFDLSIDLTSRKTLTISVIRDKHPGVQEALNLADAWLVP